jgi:amidohydrolase
MADVEYKSVNKGVMHACGHDVHTACLLGAAGILNERRKDFSGEVRLFFQQGEEVGGGGRLFARDKVFQDVSRVFGLHTAPDLRCGTVGVKSGINNASVDHFVMEIEGKSAHVCAPHLGADALFIASQIVVSLQAVTARMTSPTEPVVIGIGKLQAGTAYNTVASNAVLEGTTRNISEENRTRINTLVQKTAEHIAAIYGGRVKMIWEDFAPPLVNDASVCEEVKTAIREISEEIAIVTDRELYLSGDDFAMLQLHVPGVYAYLGTFNPDIPQTQNQYHSDCFTVDEDALVIGAALYAGCALWWLQH